MQAKLLELQKGIEKNLEKIEQEARNYLGEGGSPPCPFLKIEKKCPDFAKKVPWIYKKSALSVWILRPKFPFKRSFKSIWEKKHQTFSLRDSSFICCTGNIYRSTTIPRNLSCPEDILVASLNRNPKIKLRILYSICRTENCFASLKISLDRMGVSLNLLPVYLTFRPKSGGVPLDENFWYLQNCSWNFGSINKISLESFSYFQVWNLKYLPLYKLQFFNTTYNLLSLTWKESALTIFPISWDGISWNIHWCFPLTYEIEFWRHFDHLSLSQNSFWCIN